MSHTSQLLNLEKKELNRKAGGDPWLFCSLNLLLRVKYPPILGGPVQVIAHRGSNRKALENSMTAFEIAISEGATRIELDLHLSKDHHIFVNHDDSLKKTTKSRWCISEKNLSDLSDVQLNNGEPIPQINQVLGLLPRVELNLELKGKNKNLVDALIKLIRDHRLLNKIVVSSFEEDMLIYLKQVFPNVQRAFLTEERSFSPRSLEKVARTLEKVDTQILHPVCHSVSEDLMAKATACGWIVNTWAPLKAEIEDELWPKLYALGIHGHCTNFPLELFNWLGAKKNDASSR